MMDMILGHPPLEGQPPVQHFTEFPPGGGFPIGFLEFAFPLLGVEDPGAVLHLCSGSLRTGTCVDIRPETSPTIVCDARHVPLPDASFAHILIDPPYTHTYATRLYGTGDHFPQPEELLREAARLCLPAGRIGLLHFKSSAPPPGTRLVSVHGILTGTRFPIRAFSVYQKEN